MVWIHKRGVRLSGPDSSSYYVPGSFLLSYIACSLMMCEVIGPVLWWRGEGAKRLGNCFASIFVHHAPVPATLIHTTDQGQSHDRPLLYTCISGPPITTTDILVVHTAPPDFALYCADARAQCRHDLLLSNTRRMHRCDTLLLSETSATGNPGALIWHCYKIFSGQAIRSAYTWPRIPAPCFLLQVSR
jgi:hypothetical protein